jgi:hypothetical protein
MALIGEGRGGGGYCVSERGIRTGTRHAERGERHGRSGLRHTQQCAGKLQTQTAWSRASYSPSLSPPPQAGIGLPGQ